MMLDVICWGIAVGFAGTMFYLACYVDGPMPSKEIREVIERNRRHEN